MTPEELRTEAGLLKWDCDYQMGKITTAHHNADRKLSDFILALTDPTPVDAAWLDARWDRVHGAVAWKIHGFPNLYVNNCGDRFEVLVGPIPVSKHATRGDVVRLLWGLRVPMPEPKGGEW